MLHVAHRPSCCLTWAKRRRIQHTMPPLYDLAIRKRVGSIFQQAGSILIRSITIVVQPKILPSNMYRGKFWIVHEGRIEEVLYLTIEQYSEFPHVHRYLSNIYCNMHWCVLLLQCWLACSSVENHQRPYLRFVTQKSHQSSRSFTGNRE